MPHKTPYHHQTLYYRCEWPLRSTTHWTTGSKSSNLVPNTPLRLQMTWYGKNSPCFSCAGISNLCWSSISLLWNCWIHYEQFENKWSKLIHSSRDIISLHYFSFLQTLVPTLPTMQLVPEWHHCTQSIRWHAVSFWSHNRHLWYFFRCALVTTTTCKHTSSMCKIGGVTL